MSQTVENDSIGVESPEVPAARPGKTVKVRTRINHEFTEERPPGSLNAPISGPRPVIPAAEPTRIVMAVAEDDDEFEPDPLSQLAELCGDAENALKVSIYRLKCDAQGRPLVSDTRGMKADYGQFCGTIPYAEDLLEHVQRVYGPGEYLLVPRTVGRLHGKRYFLASIAEPRQSEAIQPAPRNDLEADFVRANRMLELKAKLDEVAMGGMMNALDRVMEIQNKMVRPNPPPSPEPIPDTREGALVYLSKDDPDLRRRAVEILFRPETPESDTRPPANVIEQAFDFIQGNPDVVQKGMELLQTFLQRAQPPQPEPPPRVLYAAPPGYVLTPAPVPPAPTEAPAAIPNPQTEPPTAPEETMPQEEAMNPLEEMIQELLDEAERNADDIEGGQWTEETENNRVSACAELVATFRAENPDYESDIGDVSKTPVRFVVNQLAAEFYADNPDELKNLPRIREFIAKLQKAIKKNKGV